MLTSVVLLVAFSATPVVDRDGGEFVRRELSVDLRYELGALALTGLAFGVQAWIGRQEDGFPVWDSAGPFDRWVRERFAPRSADARVRSLELSDAMLFGAIPLSMVVVEVYDVAFDQGTLGGAALNLYTAAVAGFMAVQVSQIFKRTIQRSRPEVFPVGEREVGVGQIHPFPSGHAINASAFVASFTTQRYLRNDPNWLWYAGLGGAMAATTGMARLGGENHWGTDVIAGLAMGTAVGMAYPLLTRVVNEEDGESSWLAVGPGSLNFTARF